MFFEILQQLVDRIQSRRSKLRRRRRERSAWCDAAEVLEFRQMLSAAAIPAAVAAPAPINVSGTYFVQSSGKTATIVQNGTSLTLTDEFGQTSRSTLVGNTFKAWGMSANVEQDGVFTEVVWPGKSWEKIDLNGSYFVHSNNRTATIVQTGTSLTLTDENGNTTKTQLNSANQFVAWGQTVEVVRNGYLTQILWNGNSWDRAQISGTYLVHSNNRVATISQSGGSLILTDENGNTATGTWLNSNQFTVKFRGWSQAQIATVEQNFATTSILWNGNSWDKTNLNGTYFVHSNGRSATIVQNGNSLTLTDENGNTTTTHFINANQFLAWGQVADVVQNGFLTQILWNGNSWDRAQVSNTYLVHSNNRVASISQDSNSLLLTDENGTTTRGIWVDADQFVAWGQVATVVQNGFLTQINWSGNSWDRPQLNGTFVVASNGRTAMISEAGTDLTFLDENGKTTHAIWVNASTFLAFGLTAHVSQNGYQISVGWPGNSWNRNMPAGTSVSAGPSAGAPVVTDFFTQLPDGGIQNLARVDYAFYGSISRGQMLGEPTTSGPDQIGIFREVEAGGSITQAELTSLHNLASSSTLLGMPGYVSDLTHKVVDGDAANYTCISAYSSTGALYVGVNPAQLGILVSDWFLGNNSFSWQGTAVLSAVAGKPFGANGPSYTDVDQGNLGDCTLMAALAEVAARNPSLIQHMFIDNGDGSYTVRFYHNGIPDYVTVNTLLPGGGQYFDRVYNNVLWAALAEKAVVQLNESGWLGTIHPGSNSYSGIDGGNPGTMVAYLSAITGVPTSGFYINLLNPIGSWNNLISAWNSGKYVIMATANVTQSPIVNNHCYAMIGYNPTSARGVELFNPWGINQNQSPAVVWQSEGQIFVNFVYAADASKALDVNPTLEVSNYELEKLPRSDLAIPLRSERPIHRPLFSELSRS